MYREEWHEDKGLKEFLAARLAYGHPDSPNLHHGPRLTKFYRTLQASEGRDQGSRSLGQRERASGRVGVITGRAMRLDGGFFRP